MRDTWADFLPWWEFAAGVLREGYIPLWNPYSGIGEPFVADPQAAVFYPLQALFLFLPQTTALGLTLILHLFIAGAGVYTLCRIWKLSSAGALMSAVSFAFSTWMVVSWEFLSIAMTVAWTPWILAVITNWIDRWEQSPVKASWFARSRRLFPRTALLALLLAVQYLAGHSQACAYMLILAVLFSVSYGWRYRFKTGLAAFSGFAQAGVLAFSWVLPQFLLTWEHIRFSERAGGIDPEMNLASIYPSHLVTLLLPFYYGEPGYGNYWGRTISEFWLGTGYIGILPLILVGFSLIHAGRSNRVGFGGFHFLTLFWLAISIFGLLLSFGQYTPLYKLLHQNLPVFSEFRWPSKFLVWVVFSFSILSGIGYEALVDSSSRRFSKRQVVLVGAWLAIFIAVAISRIPVLSISELQQRDFFHFIVVAVCVLSGVFSSFFLNRRWIPLLHVALIGITFADLFWVARQVHFFGDGDFYQYRSPVGEVLGSVRHPVRVHNIYGIEQQWLYGERDISKLRWAKAVGVGESWLPLKVFRTWHSGLKLGDYQEIYWMISEVPPARERILDLLNVCYVVSGEGEKNVPVAQRPSCLPRAYLVDQWTVDWDFKRSLQTMLSPMFDPLQEAVLHPYRSSRAVPLPTSAAGRMTVSAIDYGHNRVQVSVESEKESLLVLLDAWYPGWKVFVDGQERAIWRVNLLFRGVLLEPGRHAVVFLYRPWQFGFGVWVSLGSILLTAILVYQTVFFRKRAELS